jgi:hypothetical protein
MDVVLGSVDAVQDTISVSNDSPNEFIKFIVVFLGQGIFTVMGTKYDVIYNLSVTVHFLMYYTANIYIMFKM